MLTELHVENLGIIADLTVEFGDGMTAITGETGAGKTLLIEALELLLGARADGGLVRDGASEARVDGRFVDTDAEWVLSRVVPRDGRSRAYVNGRPATAAELAEIGASLVDLHGQHDQQSLLLPAAQRTLLDAWIGEPATELRAALRSDRAAIVGLDANLAELGGDPRGRAREIDLLRYQVDEIDAAALGDPGEDERLGREEALLGDAEAHRDAVVRARALLDEGAADALGAAVSLLSDREPFEAVGQRIRVAQDEVADLVHELRLAAEAIVADPDRLDEVRTRRVTLRELRRKYGESLAEVIAYRSEAAIRLADLDSFDARAAAISAERAALASRRDATAAALGELRREYAPALADAVTERLRRLALPNARFTIAIEAGELGDDGADRISFELAPNAGEAARPLARAASGGELSRSMLAIRGVLSHAPPTLVFDEVDAGIGGQAGIAVGAALAALGTGHQVLCVTHLAQVAAHADAQLHVSKLKTRGRTVAQAELLLDDARVSELSRMLGGVDDSHHARSHAEELLAAGQNRSPSAGARRTAGRGR